MQQEQVQTAVKNSYFIRQSPYVLIFKLVVLEAIYIGFYLLVRVPKFLFPEVIPQDLFVTWSALSVLIFVVISVVQLILSVLLTLSWANEYYIVRPTDILHRQGVLSLTEETFSLENVEAFTVKQNFVGKLLGFGSIKFYSPVLKQDYYLLNISNPLSLKDRIETAISKKKLKKSDTSREFIIPLRNR